MALEVDTKLVGSFVAPRVEIVVVAELAGHPIRMPNPGPPVRRSKSALMRSQVRSVPLVARTRATQSL